MNPQLEIAIKEIFADNDQFYLWLFRVLFVIFLLWCGVEMLPKKKKL
jgi:hypothetical protein